MFWKIGKNLLLIGVVPIWFIVLLGRATIRLVSPDTKRPEMQKKS